MSQASGTFGRMQAGSKTKTKGPGPTIGGAALSGLGAVGAGAAMAEGTGAFATAAAGLGPWGFAALGIGAYLFS